MISSTAGSIVSTPSVLRASAYWMPWRSAVRGDIARRTATAKARPNADSRTIVSSATASGHGQRKRTPKLAALSGTAVIRKYTAIPGTPVTSTLWMRRRATLSRFRR